MAIRKKRTRRIVCIVVVVVCIAVVYGGCRLFNPYNEVTTDIRGIPPNTDFVCLVAETDDGPQAMEWSLAKVFPFSMHPDDCTVSSLLVGESNHHANVRWIFSERIGVLCRTNDREWIVSWFAPPKGQPRDRSFLFGGGSVTIDLSNADTTQAMTADQLRALGMNYSLTHD